MCSNYNYWNIDEIFLKKIADILDIAREPRMDKNCSEKDMMALYRQAYFWNYERDCVDLWTQINIEKF